MFLNITVKPKILVFHYSSLIWQKTKSMGAEVFILACCVTKPNDNSLNLVDANMLSKPIMLTIGR